MRELSDGATRDVAGVVGAVVFGAASVMELVRIAITKDPWPGFSLGVARFMAVIAVAIWIPCAVVLATKSRRHRLLAITGAFTLFCYGLLGTTARSSFGVVYVISGMLMAVIERLAFGGKLVIGSRSSPPRRPTSGPPEVI